MQLINLIAGSMEAWRDLRSPFGAVFQAFLRQEARYCLRIGISNQTMCGENNFG